MAHKDGRGNLGISASSMGRGQSPWPRLPLFESAHPRRRATTPEPQHAKASWRLNFVPRIACAVVRKVHSSFVPWHIVCERD